MSNSIATATIFQDKLDKQMLQKLATGWMDANSGQVKYNGGAEIKIPKLALQGLGDYSRVTGAPAGDITFTYQTKTMTQDRGRKFTIDSMDVDESAFMVTAARVLAEFQRTQVVPEVDSYRLSAIFAAANANLKTTNYTPAVGTILTQLKNEIANIQNVIGENEPLVVMMSFAAANTLDQSTELTKKLDVNDFAQGGINLKVKMLDDGTPIIRTPSARFKTLYDSLSGGEGEEAGGLTAATLAMNQNWQIIARNAPIAVTKVDKPRIFDPNTNQTSQGWLIDYRRYHDLWIPDNKLASLWCNYTGIDAPALTATVAAGTGTGNTKFTATAAEGCTLGYTLTASGVGALDPDYNDIVVPDEDDYTSGADIAASEGQYLNMFELDSNLRVTKFKSQVLGSGDISSGE